MSNKIMRLCEILADVPSSIAPAILGTVNVGLSILNIHGIIIQHNENSWFALGITLMAAYLAALATLRSR